MEWTVSIYSLWYCNCWSPSPLPSRNLILLVLRAFEQMILLETLYKCLIRYNRKAQIAIVNSRSLQSPQKPRMPQNLTKNFSVLFSFYMVSSTLRLIEFQAGSSRVYQGSVYDFSWSGHQLVFVRYKIKSVDSMSSDKIVINTRRRFNLRCVGAKRYTLGLVL